MAEMMLAHQPVGLLQRGIDFDRVWEGRHERHDLRITLHVHDVPHLTVLDQSRLLLTRAGTPQLPGSFAGWNVRSTCYCD